MGPCQLSRVGKLLSSKAAAAESAPARASPVHGGAVQKQWIIGLGDP